MFTPSLLNKLLVNYLIMKELLEKLITFKTISKDHEENNKAIDWIIREVEHLPVNINKYDSNGFPSLTITTKKTNKPTLWLQAHLDVVSGSEDVFKPKVLDGKLFGRGAFDMKYAIACYLKLLQDFNNELVNYDFGVMITTDEEVGGLNGVKYLLDSGLGSKVCFLPDGGQNWEIQKAAKGVLHLKVESLGKSVHGSRVWEGVNAIEILIEYINRIKSHFPQEPCNFKDHFHNTINVGKIEGGKSVNQVPDFAEALLDIRYTPETKKESLLELFKEAAADLPQVTFKEIVSGSSYSIDTGNQYIKLFLQIVSKELNIEPVFITSHGSSDARFFAEKNIPTILTRPHGGSHHSEKEWVDLEDLNRFYKVLRLFVESVAKLQPSEVMLKSER